MGAGVALCGGLRSIAVVDALADVATDCCAAAVPSTAPTARVPTVLLFWLLLPVKLLARLLPVPRS